MQFRISVRLSLLIILLFSIQAFCQNGTKETKPFNVKIEYSKNFLLGDEGQLKIIFEGNPIDIQEFKFLIQYNKKHLNEFDVEVGKSLSDKGWDNLIVHTNNNPDSSNMKIIQISGSLDNNFCSFKLGDDFAVLNFRTSYDRTLRFGYLPIKFIWNASDDNTIVTYPNKTRIYSCYNYKFSGEQNLQNYSSSNFHKYIGHNTTLSPNNSKRLINFYNGGVHLDMIGMFEIYGDINLNEYCFEYDDLILFKDYFLRGNSVFNITLQGQLTLADINNDKNIDLYDFVTYSRIVNGEKVDPYHVFIQADVSYAHESNGDFIVNDDSLDVALIEVLGSVTPTLLIKNLEMDYFFDGTNTKIIVFSSKAIPFIDKFINFEGEIVNFSYISTASFNSQSKYLNISSGPIIRMFCPKEGYYHINIFNEDSILFDKVQGYFKPGEYFINWVESDNSYEKYHYHIIFEDTSISN